MDPHTLPAGVVFDCDGTLADTESVADQAWESVLHEHGYVVTAADLDAIIGRPWPQCWAYFSSRLDLGDEATFYARLRERFASLLEDGLVLYEDALGTMRSLAAVGVPIAVASSSQHAHVVGVLERGGVRDHVRAVIGQDDVERHKPDPEPYLAAARALGVAPTDCVAIEDTAVGVSSAVAAGMRTVGILRRSTPAAALVDAHTVVREVTMDVVLRR